LLRATQQLQREASAKFVAEGGESLLGIGAES
jgi:hypothetical protein